MSNRLQNEKSPYLLQHAENPVDWYPWGEEAFEKAMEEDKPVFLSIGYSTCHWCHVMEHESFEDEEVASLMNGAFVSVKVDREERPDIDNVYMTVCQILSQGGCGWPLTIIMTPDKKPFFAATYIPKENRFGRMGMKEMVPKVEDVWKNKRDEVIASANKITDALQKAGESPSDEKLPGLDEKTLDLAYNQLLSRFDRDNGGFGSAPKFPSPHQLMFLLRYHRRTGSASALNMVKKTLENMGNGGIFDHLGFGFHRYSTDPEWLVPHFEKMLYDQALLAMAFTETYQLTKKDYYRKKAQQIFEYIIRDMTSPEGGFYSAEDADSEGVEGKFYVWTADEIREVLDEESAALVIECYNVREDGNFHEEATGEKTGANILNVKESIEDAAKRLGESPEQLQVKLDKAGKILFDHREKRVHPYKDDKVLTDWNGLMIAALSKAAVVFDKEEYGNAARSAIGFVNSNMNDGARLLHRHRGGDSAITASLSDYSFFIWGLLEYYNYSFDTSYLKQAVELNRVMIEHFWDEKNGGFFFTPDYGEQLITRQKEIHDGALPSGNSVAMLNMLKIGRITADTGLEDMAGRMATAFSAPISEVPISFTMHMNALDFATGPSSEIVVVGEPDSGNTEKLLKSVSLIFNPNRVVLLKSGDDGLEKIAPYTGEMEMLDGTPTAYVCENYVCDLPTTDPEKVLEILGEKSGIK